MDLQLNGFAGFDFNSDPSGWTATDLRRVRDALRSRGILVALPTLITDEVALMLDRAARYAALLEEDPALRLAFPGLHVEGPFISPEDGPRGAHPPAHCRTPQALPGFLSMLREATGDRIAILTLAPELPGALELVRAATEAGICVALGHTSATPRRIREAVDAGARLSTHLGNGSHQLLPRLDNYVQAQLAEDALQASFIADGHHIPFYTLRNFLRAKQLDRSILVSDAIAAAGVGPGRYRLGSEEILVSPDLRVCKPGQPNLAGSALPLDVAVVNVSVHCAIPFAEAWKLASTNPARLLGLSDPPGVTVTPATIRSGVEARAPVR